MKAISSLKRVELNMDKYKKDFVPLLRIIDPQEKPKKRTYYRPGNPLDCTEVECMNCIYRNKEHCLNCLVREHFFKLTDPEYLMKD